jgi:hypothetical protein
MGITENGNMEIILGVGIAFFFVIIVQLLRIAGRLKRIEQTLKPSVSRMVPPEIHSTPQIESAPASETSNASSFEEFLNEDPSRRELSKAEQFSAFRKWRDEKGLNWSKS